MYIDRRNRRRILADDEIDVMDEEVMVDEGEDVNVAPEATDLLFEAEDVAELVAEVTGEVVDVTADGDEVVFSIGEGDAAEEYTVTAEGDEEVLEASRRVFKGKRTVAASRQVAASRRRAASRKPVVASTTRTKKTVRKVPSKRK